MVKKAENSVCVTVFFDEGLSGPAEVRYRQEYSKAGLRSQVFTIHLPKKHGVHSSKDYFGQYHELAEGFKDDNPLASSDSYCGIS